MDDDSTIEVIAKGDIPLSHKIAIENVEPNEPVGTGSNPNVAAAVVIGIGENWSKKIAEGIAETGIRFTDIVVKRLYKFII
jgi:altronate dehydratase